MNKELPVYELKINPEKDSLVDFISLVDEPAIESDFLAFNKQKEFAFKADEEKRELIGPAMLPDIKIFRRDKDGTEYNVFFSKETIREIAQTYFQKGFQNNLNIDHTATPAGSFIYQSFITDKSKGINPPNGFEELPDGSWIIGVKVIDENIWNDIKAGKQKGFSIQGIFEFFSKESHPENTINIDEVEDAVDKELLELIERFTTLLNSQKNK